MSSRNARLVVASACLLCMSLAPATAIAAPQTSGPAASTWLERLWTGLVSMWLMDGCQILPDGRVYCPTQPPPSPVPHSSEHQPSAKAVQACGAPVPGALQATPTPGQQ